MRKFVWILLLLLPLPALAGPWPFPVPLEPPRPAYLVEDLLTGWDLAGENSYNQLIIDSVDQNWGDANNPLHPLMFKSLIAVESAFKPSAVSRTGAAGLVQLTPDTARRFGLNVWPEDQRVDPVVAVPVGVAVLREKHLVITNPDQYYQILLDKPKRTAWGDTVALAYHELGPPEGADLWRLDLAAFNGGGQTVLRAMARAREQGLDPRRWDNLIQPVDHPSESPLHFACRQIYRDGATRKYYEMSEYPEKVFRYYQQAGGG